MVSTFANDLIYLEYSSWNTVRKFLSAAFVALCDSSIDFRQEEAFVSSAVKVVVKNFHQRVSKYCKILPHSAFTSRLFVS